MLGKAEAPGPAPLMRGWRNTAEMVPLFFSRAYPKIVQIPELR